MQKTLGENILVEVSDSKAVLTIDLAYRGRLSATGKSVRVASTEGNVKIPGSDITIGLNAYVKP